MHAKDIFRENLINNKKKRVLIKPLIKINNDNPNRPVIREKTIDRTKLKRRGNHIYGGREFYNNNNMNWINNLRKY